MPSEKRKIGDIGEAVAVRFLVKSGFRVLERNFLRKWGEIDIIAEKNHILHFIEVKTLQTRVSRESRDEFSRETLQRNRQASYNPAENVHPKKLERIHRTVEMYLDEKQVSHEKEWQIDVATVLLDLNSRKARVGLLENIV